MTGFLAEPAIEDQFRKREQLALNVPLNFDSYLRVDEEI